MLWRGFSLYSASKLAEPCLDRRLSVRQNLMSNGHSELRQFRDLDIIQISLHSDVPTCIRFDRNIIITPIIQIYDRFLHDWDVKFRRDIRIIQ